MDACFFCSCIFVGNSVGLALCRELALRDEADRALGLLDLAVSLERQALDARTDTHVIPYGMSALKGNHRGEGLGPPGKASLERR